MPAGCQIHVGTSGWHYKHWVGDFYPAQFPTAKMFSWYAREFHTVEINNSFYRLPEEKTFQNWRDLAPPGFLFAVKASRFITHIKRLKDVESSVELLFSRARPLSHALGPVLFQLPPNWKLNLDRLSELLRVLPREHLFAVEFRDMSWCVPQVYELLRWHNVAFCVHDWHAMAWPRELTANFTYIRFHGGPGHSGNYSNRELLDQARFLRDWSAKLSQAFVYFNNDAHGHAIRNARRLRELLGETAHSSFRAA